MSSASAASAAEAVRSIGSSFSAEELQKILQQRNASTLSESLNKVKKLGATRDGLQLLEQVWTGNQSQYPELSWEAISDPGVRLDLADILLQAAKNGDITQEPVDVHDFVRNILDTGSPKMVSQAAITLSTFDEDADVPALERIALQRDSRTFRSIIIALSRMCASAADEALNRIEQEATASDKEFIRDTKTRMTDFKRQPGACQP
ncbi:hypothetical protein [Peristeroidobacter agariperforans]|uniref:hypothetical protein n=1 Tax=Peristeroidobacter agariperforans TaxID=268404 RepID=UPI001E327875|nr:hypothetical protein [Peristeroidobacter agariperforans]